MIIALLALILNSMVFGIDVYLWLRQGIEPDGWTVLAIMFIAMACNALHDLTTDKTTKR